MSVEKDLARVRRLVIKLLSDSPFYGHTLALTSRVIDEGLGPFAAAMTITNTNLVIIFNPKYFFSKDEAGQLWTLVHEICHFLFKHPWRSKARGKLENPDTDLENWTTAQVEFFIENIAMDLAINSFMKHHYTSTHPSGIPMPPEFGFPENKTFEWYLKQLMDAAKCPKCGLPQFGAQGQSQGDGDGQDGKDGGQGDGDGQDGKDGKGKDGSGQGKQKQKQGQGKGKGRCNCGGGKAGQQLKKWVGQHFGHSWNIQCDDATANNIANRMYRHGERMAGTSSLGHLRDVYKVDAQADFRDVIMRLAQSSELSDEQVFHKRRVSRRYHRPPGSKYDVLGELHYLVDTSGSMGPKEIGACFSVCDKLRRMGYVTYVYEFDADFHPPEYEYKGTPPKVKGGGGTMMMSTLKYIRENKPHVKEVCVATDSYIGDLPPKIPEGFKNIIFVIPDWVDNKMPEWAKVVKFSVRGGRN